jgi:hypothetical protein
MFVLDSYPLKGMDGVGTIPKMLPLYHAYGDPPVKQESFILTRTILEKVIDIDDPGNFNDHLNNDVAVDDRIGVDDLVNKHVHEVLSNWIVEMQEELNQLVKNGYDKYVVQGEANEGGVRPLKVVHIAEPERVSVKFRTLLSKIENLLSAFSTDGCRSMHNAELSLDLSPLRSLSNTYAISEHYGLDVVCITSSFKMLCLYAPAYTSGEYRNAEPPLPGYEGTMDNDTTDSAKGKVGWVIEECNNRSRKIHAAIAKGLHQDIAMHKSQFRPVTHPYIHDIRSQTDLTTILEDVIKEHCDRSQLVMIPIFMVGDCDQFDEMWGAHSMQLVINQVTKKICLQDANCAERVPSERHTWVEEFEYIAAYIGVELGDFMAANDAQGVLRTKPSKGGGHEARGTYEYEGYCEKGVSFRHGGTCHYASIMSHIDPSVRRNITRYMQRLIWVLQTMVNRHWKVTGHRNGEAIEWTEPEKLRIQMHNDRIKTKMARNQPPNAADLPGQFNEYNRYSKREYQTTPGYMTYPDHEDPGAREDPEFLRRIKRGYDGNKPVKVPLVHLTRIDDDRRQVRRTRQTRYTERFAIYVDADQLREMHVVRGLFKSSDES